MNQLNASQSRLPVTMFSRRSAGSRITLHSLPPEVRASDAGWGPRPQTDSLVQMHDRVLAEKTKISQELLETSKELNRVYAEKGALVEKIHILQYNLQEADKQVNLRKAAVSAYANLLGADHLEADEIKEIFAGGVQRIVEELLETRRQINELTVNAPTLADWSECSITGETMEDPVMLVETGNTYEKKSLDRFWNDRASTGKFPAHRDPISNLDLKTPADGQYYIPNRALKHAIEAERFKAVVSRD